MTEGQDRAVRELRRLAAVEPSAFSLIRLIATEDGWLRATVSLRIGAIESVPDGLDLREREEFVLRIPPDFPFEPPRILVTHSRFSGFPHVTWTYHLCLYQSQVEWNAADGLYGFFDRLKMWLTRAAMNDMDPIAGPLEPPHGDTDFTQKPFLVSVDAPCVAGDRWQGLAILREREATIEVTGWDDLSDAWPSAGQLAFAAVLPQALPMEFPTNGKALLYEFARAGMTQTEVIKNLALAALLTEEGRPIHWIVGLPMRRASDGSPLVHFVVWSCEAERASALRAALPGGTDSESVRAVRAELVDILVSIVELSSIKWCRVLEDRPEVVLRRDAASTASWFRGKKIAVLGCGALGSWATEMIARAGPRELHLVDSAEVRPGLLVRQNFERSAIGTWKANALASRVRSIALPTSVEAHVKRAEVFLAEQGDALADFDLVCDCTASTSFQGKLERDWLKVVQRPAFMSMVIDGDAQHVLCVVVPKGSAAGVWDAYQLLKWRLSGEPSYAVLASAFYCDRAAARLFQPEPGCSDPTFRGSTADVLPLAAYGVNASAAALAAGLPAVAAVSSLSSTAGASGMREMVPLPSCETVSVGAYRVRIAKSVFAQARGWVRHSARVRGPEDETGGLLWGRWDDAAQVVWILDVSGPPSDSQHSRAQFLCGTEGTREEHRMRSNTTYGACGFVGHWHTHPNLPARQSLTDIGSMAALVSTMGANQRRSVMLIFGRTHRQGTAGVYLYESEGLGQSEEPILCQMTQVALDAPVV